MNADIYTMAKGMGNGFPVGGILISPKIEARQGMLGTTFGGNHLACAAALAVLEVMESENLMQNAETIGQYILSELRMIPELQNVRGRGLMIGFDTTDELRDLRKNLLFTHRIFTGEDKPNTIRLLPSLALRRKDADEFLESIREEIHAPATEER